MQEADRQDLAVVLFKVKIDGGGARLARLGADGLEQRHAVAGDDLRYRQPAGAERGEIDSQPVGERGVQVGDAPVAVGGEEAGRRVVEMVDRLLQVLEEALLLGTFAGNVGQLPDEMRLGVARHLQRPGGDPVPARLGVGGAQRMGKPELLARLQAVAQPVGHHVEDVRRLVLARQQRLDRLDVGGALRAGQFRIGAVGIDDAALLVGDHQAVIGRVEIGLGEGAAIGFRRQLDEAHDGAEQVEEADDGEDAEDTDDDGFVETVAEQAKRRGNGDEDGAQDEYPGYGHRPGCLVDQRADIPLDTVLWCHSRV